MQGEGDGNEVQARSNQSEGVKEFVVTKNTRDQSRTFRAIKNSADGIGQPTRNHQPEDAGSTASVDLGHNGYRRPAHHEIGQGVHPLGRVERELANGDPDHRARSDHDHEYGADRAVHGESGDGEIATGDSEENRRVVRPPPGPPVRRRPVHAVKECARQHHRSDAGDVATDPKDLGPRVGPGKEQGRTGEKDNDTTEVKPTSHQWLFVCRH